MSEVPRFAVVGRVNKGKSSIVSTLAEDDSVRIDARPGTTTEVREFPVRVDGRTLFVLVDSPGFEDAPRALAWLRARDYRGWVVVEQDVLPGMGSPRASAQRIREFLRSIGL